MPEASYDESIGEWIYEYNGVEYFGATPDECYTQAAEDARVAAAHWERCGKHWANEPRHYQDNEGELQSCQMTN